MDIMDINEASAFLLNSKNLLEIILDFQLKLSTNTFCFSICIDRNHSIILYLIISVIIIVILNFSY